MVGAWIKCEMLGKPIWDRIEGKKHLIMYDMRDGMNLLIFEIDDQKKLSAMKCAVKINAQ